MTQVWQQPGAKGTRTADQLPASSGSSIDEPEVKMVDVWSRTTSKYRFRSVLLLITNAVLFGGLCCFSYWLRSGYVVPFLQDDYWGRWQAFFQPTGETQFTLADFLKYPISVEHVPLQIVIHGLLLASLISIPILVAILYRFPFSLIFTALVAFLAMMPWLAITLLVSCLLATAKRLAFPFRYASALLGLVPVVFYLIGATREPRSTVTLLSPADQASVYAPWLLAMIASCLLMAIVLIFAWVVNYRPGAIAPLLAVMFATPVVLFETKVGRDELYYRLIEHNYGLNYFQNIRVDPLLRRMAYAKMRSNPNGEQDLTAVMNIIKLLVSQEITDAADDRMTLFAQQRYEAIREYNAFLKAYHRSRYVPNVLYLKARAQDTRIDMVAFRQESEIRYYNNVPREESQSTWQTLVEQYPDALPTSVAHFRLAQLAARAGDVDNAILHSERSLEIQSLYAETATQAAAETSGRLLDRPPTSSTLGINQESLKLNVLTFLVFLKNNRDPLYGNEPLAEFMKLDSRHSLYVPNLQRIINRFPKAQIVDNLVVRWANSLPSRVRRIESLKQCLADYSKGDAVPECMYWLGEAFREDSQSEEARLQFQALIDRFPTEPWADNARRQLANLSAVLPQTDKSRPEDS
jgi:outer membrane protein assembly factor BamD (BamD/ComL family)